MLRQAQQQLKTDGTAVSASGGEVRPKSGRKSNTVQLRLIGRKSVLRHSPTKLEAQTSAKQV